ncbi:MAG TPA: glycoside hydrolase family 35 protein [Tepidisphaeraceae bacterium]|nr:glycoside hydrolase family 35 protein [Tepidisphaeraceae bacterium]
MSQSQITFAIRGADFVLNDRPLRIFSGELHYFRNPREYWRDRLLKARAMGLNAICTYMPWNLHEPTRGQFEFGGMLDVAEFFRLAQEIGLYVLLRPGPYICAEWDFGGLPAWLLKDGDLRIRCADRTYLEAMTSYIERVGRELSPLCVTRGGPILMLQVENEYGSYGNDKSYLRTLRDLLRRVGFDVPLFTSDGSDPDMLAAGTVEDCLAVVNFGSNAQQHIGALRAFRSNQPAMCGEFWCGWFDAWGKPRQGNASTAMTADVKWMLENDASFNIYMLHGGTNFGFTSGANFYDDYQPQVTSYDYWAPLDEAGRPQPKYWAVRELLAKYQRDGAPLPDVPPPTKIIAIPGIRLTESASLFDNLPDPIASAAPRSMEQYGQNSGLILYRTNIAGLTSRKLKVVEPRDYAKIYVDGKEVATLDRRLKQTDAELPVRKIETLDILIDSTGRVNYGPKMLDRKGITERVVLDKLTLMDWRIYPLPMDAKQLASLKYGTDDIAGPAFHRGTFEVTETGDTFLDLRGWRKGAVWINGHNLGRFWHIGPQQTLYCPGVWLERGSNEIVVFDLEADGRRTIQGLSEPVLNECLSVP